MACFPNLLTQPGKYLPDESMHHAHRSRLCNPPLGRVYPVLHQRQTTPQFSSHCAKRSPMLALPGKKVRQNLTCTNKNRRWHYGTHWRQFRCGSDTHRLPDWFEPERLRRDLPTRHIQRVNPGLPTP